MHAGIGAWHAGIPIPFKLLTQTVCKKEISSTSWISIVPH